MVGSDIRTVSDELKTNNIECYYVPCFVLIFYTYYLHNCLQQPIRCKCRLEVGDSCALLNPTLMCLQ